LDWLQLLHLHPAKKVWKTNLSKLKHPSNIPTQTVQKMSDIKVPLDFNWETSRDVNVKLTTTDSRFLDAMHLVTIYSADPIVGGIKIGRRIYL
jgi:hypothetical protein